MISDMLIEAARVAVPAYNDHRNFWLGAVGVRRDGAMVYSRNGAAVHAEGSFDNQMIASTHAEGRLLRKLGKGGIICVARVSKLTKQLAMARPCGFCQAGIEAMAVKKVIYSINEIQYGIWDLVADTDRVYTLPYKLELNITT